MTYQQFKVDCGATGTPRKTGVLQQLLPANEKRAFCTVYNISDDPIRLFLGAVPASWDAAASWPGEQFDVAPYRAVVLTDYTGIVSVRGRYVSRNTFQVAEYERE